LAFNILEEGVSPAPAPSDVFWRGAEILGLPPAARGEFAMSAE